MVKKEVKEEKKYVHNMKDMMVFDCVKDMDDKDDLGNIEDVKALGGQL